MNSINDHADLRAAAEAAHKSLEKLLKQRDELNRQLGAIQGPIAMLQNVVGAWEQINPHGRQETLIPESPPPVGPERAARGEITKKVTEVMSDRRPRSAAMVHQEIKRRFNVDPSINAVSVALRRGTERGKFEKTTRGEYVSR